jgi:hypothetical protein
MPPKYPHQPIAQPITDLLLRDQSGSQFLLYGELLLRMLGAPNESTFASVNFKAATGRLR